jgi:hypothetical protein
MYNVHVLGSKSMLTQCTVMYSCYPNLYKWEKKFLLEDKHWWLLQMSDVFEKEHKLYREFHAND